MPDLSHDPTDIKDWKGMYTRGIQDSCPPGYFTDALNVKFFESDVQTRDGSTLEIAQINVSRTFEYKKLTGSRQLLAVNVNPGITGNIVDSTLLGFGIIPPITEPSIVDFSMINISNRAYITNHNRVNGIPGSAVYVYDDINIGALARRAAGLAPTGFVLGAVQSGAAGNCEAGTHLIAVVNITNSGFITAPGPALFVPVTSTGGFAIDVSNVQPGPTGTVARAIVATKAIQNYNGNQLAYQFFQVSTADGGLIADNVTLTTRLSFFDSELTIDADYLFNNLATIPSGTGLTEYKGRMVLWGILGSEHSVYLSKAFSPEEFNLASGVITVDPFESHSSVTNCFTFRGSLIICKRNRIYTTTDNGGDPSTWEVDVVDNGAGTECFGVAQIIDSKGQENDRTFIADRGGLLIYEGYVRRPEATWLVEDTWRRINKAVFNLVQVCTDPVSFSIFVTLPLDGSVSINYILYGYYGACNTYYGFDPKQIKWSLWQMADPAISILVDIDPNTNESVLKYVGAAGVYNLKFNNLVHTDNGVAFTSYVQTALYGGAKSGWISHFAALKLRALGSGTSTSFSLFSEDNVTNYTVPPITLSATPGQEILVLTNFQNEKASIKLSFVAPNWFKLSKITLFNKPLWFTRSA